MKKTKLMLGDNIESLKKLPDNSIDSVVSDPPYGLSAPKNSGKSSQGGFMGKKWDYDVPTVEFWKEVYRVLKPGGHILSFGGTRTYHRMVVNIEDAGFEIRDQVMWLYGSGFPKSHNIGKAVDKIEGNEREVVGQKTGGAYSSENNIGINRASLLGEGDGRKTAPTRGEDFGKITKGTSPYEGWGTSLKPANEPICVARKPLSENTIAENVLKWGTGGINIDKCRVGTETISTHNAPKGTFAGGELERGSDTNSYTEHEGRFPANIILDETAAELLDEQTGYLKSGEVKPHHKKNKTANGYQGNCYGKFQNEDTTLKGYGDGGASRFFYVAKVSKKERNLGLDGFEEKGKGWSNHLPSTTNGTSDVIYERTTTTKNSHPTVKPINLMTYLCRLVTPVGGIVLDPFMGSGSTGISACLEGFRFVGMEMDEDYFKIAQARIEAYEEYRKLLK